MNGRQALGCGWSAHEIDEHDREERRELDRREDH